MACLCGEVVAAGACPGPSSGSNNTQQPCPSPAHHYHGSHSSIWSHDAGGGVTSVCAAGMRSGAGHASSLCPGRNGPRVVLPSPTPDLRPCVTPRQRNDAGVLGLHVSLLQAHVSATDRRGTTRVLCTCAGDRPLHGQACVTRVMRHVACGRSFPGSTKRTLARSPSLRSPTCNRGTHRAPAVSKPRRPAVLRVGARGADCSTHRQACLAPYVPPMRSHSG